MFAGTFETEIGTAELLVRLGMAVLAGAVIGFEREVAHRPAGLRTNMLVALASAIFMVLAIEFVIEATEANGIVGIDTTRVVQAVIAGVGFLGAGAIFKSGDSIRGLTTGASLWMSGAVGVACGGGFYLIAGAGVGFSLLILLSAELIKEPIPEEGEDED